MWVEIFFKHYLYIFHCKSSFPYCGPTQTKGIMIWTNMNSHYPRILLYKLQFFWPVSVWKYFTRFSLYLPLYSFINPLWPHPSLADHELNQLELLYPRMLPQKAERLWPISFFRDFLSIFKCKKILILDFDISLLKKKIIMVEFFLLQSVQASFTIQTLQLIWCLLWHFLQFAFFKRRLMFFSM